MTTGVGLKDINIDEILLEAVRLGHKDVHIKTDECVAFKSKDGDVIKAKDYIIPNRELLKVLVDNEMLDKRQQDLLYKGNYHETNYKIECEDGEVRKVRRLVIFLHGNYSLVFRIRT